MDFGLAFALVTGLISLVAALVRATRAVEEAHRRVAKLETQKLAQIGRLRKIARRCLNLRREIRSARHRLETTEQECRETEKSIRELERQDRNLYVLDDRRTPADRTWIAIVHHQDFATVNPRVTAEAAASWLRGRRYVVWALDQKKAREKVAVKFPDRSGYLIHSIHTQTDAEVQPAAPKVRRRPAE